MNEYLPMPSPWKWGPTKLIRLALGLLLSVLSLVCFFLAVWLLVFGCLSGASFAVFALVVVWPTGAASPRVWAMRGVLGVVWVVGMVAASGYLVEEVNGKIQRLAALPRTKGKLAQFTFQDKLGIYGLNLAMGAAALPLYPEVSRETLLMTLAAPEEGVRRFDSEFPLGSQRIRALVGDFRKRKPATPDSVDRNWEGKVAWPLSEYAIGKPEARWALALNPAQVRIRTLAGERHRRLHVSVEVRVEYPASCRVVLVGNPRLAVEEGLFWVLQEEGWLHPYTASWQFILDTDDPRIQ
ncbi:MAG TPA: hypothetical protein PKO15_07315 [Fibrobacteria bacterium]|nr:hypothetical protein [Fibrobacteria bacterium]HOX50964.1 hypothetical protein [Fibrobacteria bacterium]